MTRRSLLVAGSLAAAACGCRTSPFDELVDGAAADLRAPPADAPPADAPPAGADLAPPPGCRTHRLETVRLTALETVEPAAFLDHQMALRVRVRHPLRAGCDLPGPVAVAVEIGDATDVVTITASCWRANDDGAPCAAGEASRVLVLSEQGGPLTSPHLVVRDGAPGGTARLDLAPTFSPVASCDPRAVGKPCQIDCQCEAGHLLARCVPTARGAGTCAIPCHQDEDCRSPLLQCSNAPTPTAPASTCIAAGPPCTSDAACPFGRRCLDGPGGRRCRPAQATTPPPPCACGADCGFGRVCEQSPTGMVQQCATPCATDGDCPLAGAPAPHRCAAGRCTPGQ